MKKLFALTLALMMVVGLFAACGEKTEPEVTEEKTTTAPSQTQETTEPEQTQDPNVRSLVVTVVDQDGNPMQGVMVQFCDDNGCAPFMTGEDGTAKCPASNDKVVKIMDMPAGYDYATEQTEWAFDENDQATIVLKAVA